MKQGLPKLFRLLSLVSFSLFLAGCKVELYSGLTEKEGNEMLAILLDSGIASEKLLDKDKMVTLMVDTNDVSHSVKLLSSLGYPQEKYSSIGDIFPKDGLISSPTEERARYMYSMSQELSSTLSMIDGVIIARVHVVLPQEQETITDVNFPSSASVFIKYTPELELAGLIPKVKTLVANSIEGLSLDKISVSLFPASRLNTDVLSKPLTDSVLFIQVNSASAGGVRILVYSLITLLLAAIGGGGFLFWNMQKKNKIRKKKRKKRPITTEVVE
ncbi:EscJ/YscJ/HrcJ family type III secretion inner membrane ring protein [Endozoicomonas sp. (ex Bugula neritina AB1)]|nr:EscJ/YscJ/HrcJ family type III secretion inner membrane ring protein [Endozoicomonas sp. (ex Bugula neritina AB1)]